MSDVERPIFGAVFSCPNFLESASIARTIALPVISTAAIKNNKNASISCTALAENFRKRKAMKATKHAIKKEANANHGSVYCTQLSISLTVIVAPRPPDKRARSSSGSDL